MFLSRTAVALLSTSLGCQQFTYWVSAFTRSPLPHPHGFPTKLSVALESVEEEEVATKASREHLMDETLLLYSIVSQRTKVDCNAEGDHDILNLRGSELTALFEDAVFDGRGIQREGSTMEELISVSIEEEPNKPSTIAEVSQELDDQILLGYEATFTEEELEEWIERINSLQHQHQTMLAKGESSEDSTETELAPSPPTPLDRMHGRLESMRALIDPEGNGRVQLPMARPMVVSTPKIQSKSVAEPVGMSEVSPDSLNLKTETLPAFETTTSDDEETTATVQETEEEDKIDEKKDALDEISALGDVPPEILDLVKLKLDADTVVQKSEPQTDGDGYENEDKESNAVENEPSTEMTETVPPTSTEINSLGNAVDSVLTEINSLGNVVDSILTEIDEESNADLSSVTNEPSTEMTETVPTSTDINSLGNAVDSILTEIDSLDNTVDSILTEIDSSDNAADSTPTPTLESTDDFESTNDAEPMSTETTSTPASSDASLDVQETDPTQASIDPTPTSDSTTLQDDGEESSEPAEVPVEHSAPRSQNLDMVSSLVATGAIGAVAATANPLFFAGIALGPVIREAIVSAKSRVKTKTPKDKPIKAKETQQPEASKAKPEPTSTNNKPIKAKRTLNPDLYKTKLKAEGKTPPKDTGSNSKSN